MQKISLNALIVLSTLIGLFSPMSVSAEPSAASAIVQANVSERLLHTRSLAATCAACHSKQQNNPAQVNSIYMPLYGMDSSYFISQMLAFKAGERTSTVMQRHAKGLSAEEISDLSNFFAAQELGDVQALPQQQLLRTHPH